MYRIVKDGDVIGLTERPNYIRLQDNNSYGLCPACDAQGIVYEGTIYHLIGRDELPDVESISLEQVDAGSVLLDNQAAVAANAAAIDDIIVSMLEV